MFLSAAKHWKYCVARQFAIVLLTLYAWGQTPGHDWRPSIPPYDSRFSGVVDRVDARHVLLFKRGPDDAARLAPPIAQEPQRYVRIYENGEFEIYEVRRSAPHASYLPTAWNL
jgi:hypothetical protein